MGTSPGTARCAMARKARARGSGKSGGTPDVGEVGQVSLASGRPRDRQQSRVPGATGFGVEDEDRARQDAHAKYDGSATRCRTSRAFVTAKASPTAALPSQNSLRTPIRTARTFRSYRGMLEAVRDLLKVSSGM